MPIWEFPKRALLGPAKVFISVLLLSICIHPVASLPSPADKSQSPLSALQLPKCALQCFISGILTDGCANEADFACHCGAGDILQKAAACIEQGCNAADETDAFAKVRAACSATGSGSGGGGGGTSRSRSETSTAIGTSSNSKSPGGIAPTSSQPVPTSTPRNLQSAMPSASQTPASSFSTSSHSSTSSPPTANPSRPTNIALALLPPSSQLSDGAKAAISVSVSLFVLASFLALGLYIRRLKRDLHAAQTTASLSESAWCASTTPIEAPTRSHSRRRHESPLSPLSPEMMTISDNGYGVLMKKRGNVLSIVVEDDEDGRSALGGVREPVPGQREGLSEPLEMNGEGLVEMPLAVTPRERSLERSKSETARGL